ncbi:hypothetical protein E4U10_004171 [Claviceps purpurea]|nr:hypothetical protein E4U10_004171 [Claviceps purpurea]
MRPANLARHGRQLLIHHPPAAAPACLSYASIPRRRPIARPAMRRTFQRTFLNVLFAKPPRQIRKPDVEPGWTQIMLWRSRVLDNVRPPSRKELRNAWRKLMQSKLKKRRPLNSTQALQCQRLLKYLSPEACQSQGQERDAEWLSRDDLTLAQQVLLEIEPQERTRKHLEFAKALHAAWPLAGSGAQARDSEWQWRFLVQAMSEFQGSEEAMKMLQSKWNNPVYSLYLTKQDSLLESVARGLARENKEAELVALATYAIENGVPYNAALQAVMVEYFASRNRVSETQHWLNQPIGKDEQPEAQVYRIIASFAWRNGLQAWAVPLFIKLGESLPSSQHWDVILQSILLLGRRLSEVKVIMSHMVDSTGPISPTVSTMNGLLTVAVETQHVALADGVLALATEKKILPNGETHLLLLQLRLKTGDVKGAKRAYQQVRHHEPWRNEADGDALFTDFCRSTNGLLNLLSQKVPPDYRTILAVLRVVEDEQIFLDPATVVTLCIKFLENQQNFDVMDLLSIHYYHFSEQQRLVVQNAFVAFCLDPQTSTARAWGACQILQQYFHDTSVERNMQLMQGFFDRKRPDMALHVISHMRLRPDKIHRPVEETYIRYLEGVAQHPDEEGLLKVHDMLKTDTTIQLNTRLRNGLMLAYTACEMPFKALEFWRDITFSAEGPSYASLEAVFWALEKKPGGGRQAREIWEKMERMDLEVPVAVYNAYVGVTASNGNENETQALLLNMAFQVGSEPDSMTLAIAHNALPAEKLQQDFREWAQKKYRAAWSKLDKVGRRSDTDGRCQIQIQRVMKT